MNDQTLTEAEIADLRCLAGMIIPASANTACPAPTTTRSSPTS